MVNYIKHNAIIYGNVWNLKKTLYYNYINKFIKYKGVKQNIEVINSDFLNMRNFRADLVFLNPDILDDQKNDKFDIHQHLSPNIE